MKLVKNDESLLRAGRQQSVGKFVLYQFPGELAVNNLMIRWKR